MENGTRIVTDVSDACHSGTYRIPEKEGQTTGTYYRWSSLFEGGGVPTLQRAKNRPKIPYTP